MTTTTISLEQHLKIIESLDKEIVYLKEQIEWFKRQVFWPKS